MITAKLFTKKQIEVCTRIIGLLCLFFVIARSTSMPKADNLAQESSFVVAVFGIIFLSISLNLQLKVVDENPNFFQRNTPLIYGCVLAILLSIFFIYNNF